jgi:hypothetical protein
MQLVTIFKTLNSVEAELASSRLAAADFHPLIMNEAVSAGFAAGGILLQVPDDEADDAREFLASSDDKPSA